MCIGIVRDPLYNTRTYAHTHNTRPSFLFLIGIRSREHRIKRFIPFTSVPFLNIPTIQTARIVDEIVSTVIDYALNETLPGDGKFLSFYRFSFSSLYFEKELLIYPTIFCILK